MQPEPHGRVVVAVNPAAGLVTDPLISAVVAECRRWWAEVSVHSLGTGVRATDLVRAVVTAAGAPAAQAVVTVGGDGTARDMAAALAGVPAAPPMFVVPAGTANSGYRTWWGDLPWPDALARAAADIEAATLWLDLARLAETGELVLAGACAGFPPQAIYEARQLTDLAGRSRYEAALHNLIARFEPYPGRVLVDGVPVHHGPTLLANVGGSRFRGGQFELLPYSVLDDGLLDVCVIGAEHHPAEVLRSTRAGAHVGGSGVIYARGRCVRIERTDGRPVWFEHDGEVLVNVGHTFTLSVLPRAVPMLVGPWARPCSGGAWPARLATSTPR